LGLGFLLSFYRKNYNKELDVFVLFLLLQIMEASGLSPILLTLLEVKNIDKFNKFSLKILPQITENKSKIVLEEINKKPQILLPVLTDLLI
jgi:hypothetical protein